MLVSAIIFTSCTSNDDDDNNNGGQTVEAGFFYGENGTTTLTKAENAWANGQFNSIIAQNNGATIVEINLSGLTTGTYDLSGQYAFSYVSNGAIWESSAGTLTITKNESGKLSGTFNATAGSGVSGINSVSGKFNDIPIN